MARRKTMKRKTRTRRKRGFNIVNAAELYLQTDVLTRNFAGTTPLTFFTGQEMGNVGTATQIGTGRTYSVQGMGYFPANDSITLPELLGIGSAPIGGVRTNQILMDNIRANAVNALIQSAGIKIGFTIGKRLLSKQRSFINNKVLEPLGMKSTVVV